MPGCATIVGLIPCTQGRYLHPEKPRTITMDAEIVIGTDAAGNVQTTTALLQYFVPTAESRPESGLLYFVMGKIASMDPSIQVGVGDDDLWRDEYDFVIDADAVRCPVCFIFRVCSSSFCR
jgi:hypothetical protein